MNSDNNANNMSIKHKKIILLYNDNNGWISYISENWNNCILRT